MSSLRKFKKKSLYAIGLVVSLALSYLVKEDSSETSEFAGGFSFPHAKADIVPQDGGGGDGSGDGCQGTSDAGGSDGSDGGCTDSGDEG